MVFPKVLQMLCPECITRPSAKAWGTAESVQTGSTGDELAQAGRREGECTQSLLSLLLLKQDNLPECASNGAARGSLQRPILWAESNGLGWR